MTKLRVVQVGCGGISHMWLGAAKNNEKIEMVGLVDLDRQTAQTRAEEYGFHDAVIETDLIQALDQLKPDIVFNCTIPDAHADVTIQALQRGVHVLGEKPLADSMESAQRMVAVAKESGKLFAVMQNRRYDPHIRHVRNLIDTGAIGPVTNVNSDFYIGAHFGGFREHMPHILLIDMAIHTFDGARYITQADPVSVYCREWNPSGSWFDDDASAIAIFEMSDGSVYTYRGSWCADGLATPWQSDWRIIGERGTIKWSDQDIKAQRVASTGGFFSTCEDIEIPKNLNIEFPLWHATAIDEFIECVKSGSTPETNGEDNIKSLAMVFAAIESAESGKTVKVDYGH